MLTLSALGTNSCNAFILSAILSLRNCISEKKNVFTTKKWPNNFFSTVSGMETIIEMEDTLQNLCLLTRSAILWGSVACPRLALTLGRMAGG